MSRTYFVLFGVRKTLAIKSKVNRGAHRIQSCQTPSPAVCREFVWLLLAPLALNCRSSSPEFKVVLKRDMIALGGTPKRVAHNLDSGRLDSSIYSYISYQLFNCFIADCDVVLLRWPLDGLPRA